MVREDKNMEENKWFIISFFFFSFFFLLHFFFWEVSLSILLKLN